VARASYIDPRVISRYQEGRTIAAALGELGKAATSATSPPRGRAEQVVLDLLTSA
jgi:DNA topoisomerase IB